MIVVSTATSRFSERKWFNRPNRFTQSHRSIIHVVHVQLLIHMVDAVNEIARFHLIQYILQRLEKLPVVVVIGG